MRQKTVAIIHYNTPELTEAAIMSLRKHGGRSYNVVVFDNSDQRPFADINPMDCADDDLKGVTVIDNTKGQIIDFDKELEKFPERDRTIGCAKGCEFGSAKHMMTVQKLWELLPDGFVLMESDVLIKKSINEFFRPEYSVVGYHQKAQPHNPYGIGRMLPMLCWMNVPMLRREGAVYFDPSRSYGLLPGGHGNRNNWYDTGAALLEDIMRKRPRLKGLHIDIRDYVEHYGSGSWAKNDQNQQMEWLKTHMDLWNTTEPTVAVCAIGRGENLYAREWVEHYKAMGVTRIYIYDNNREGEERFSDVLQDYIDSGFVVTIPFVGLQREAYERFYNENARKYDWVGFLDFDEFVEIDDGVTIPAYLTDMPGDAVVLNWEIMTDNGLTHYDPRPVRERFTEGTSKDFGINRHTKFFIHTDIKDIAIQDPHCPTKPEMVVVDAMGFRVPQQPIQESVIHHPARVVHYDTKTADEYINVKWKRGSCCGEEYTKAKRRTCVDYFFGINQRTAEKERILSGKDKGTALWGQTFDGTASIGKPKTKKTRKSKK